jgi:predicted nucleic acid-binding protein
LETHSQYEWTPKRKLHNHRFKRFCGWRRGRNAGKTWADFEKWEKEHPDDVTLESIIRREEEEQEKARIRRLEEEESWHIADLRKELIRLIRRKDWTNEEKRKAIGVVNMTSNAKIKELNLLE